MNNSTFTTLKHTMSYLSDVFSRSYVYLFLPAIIFTSCHRGDYNYAEWQVYGGTKNARHYSALKEINTANVSKLTVAWTYHTGDADTALHTQIQCNPIVIDGTLYGTSPKMKLFALDAGTGKQQWLFDPAVAIKVDTAAGTDPAALFSNTGRGVTYWTDGKNDKRIFYTAAHYLLCINAIDGRPVGSFGNDGHVDLHDGLGADRKDRFITSNTPGIIYKDLLIVGSRVAEDATAAPGHIRAYDVRTGKIRWTFHTIPQPGEFGYESLEDKDAWKHLGGANCWAGMSLDEKTGTVFVPTGAIAADFYGGSRLGDGLFGNCILALDAATGKRIWHFQTVHHDLWDRDPPSAPVLVSIKKDGKDIDALAQTTKAGFIFLLDRTTGKPIYPVEERPVPATSDLAGEKPSPTQPVPTWPKPFVRQALTEKDLNDLVPDSEYIALKRRLAGLKTGDIFTPPSRQGTVIFPGFDGGAEWGGPAYDPASDILYVNASEMPWILTMIEVKDKAAHKEDYLEAGKRLYRQNCMSCHGPERKGGGNYPSLLSVNKKYSDATFHQLLSAGRGMMPAFNRLTEQEQHAIAAFILEQKDQHAKPFVASSSEDDRYLHLPYTNTGYHKFLTREGYPAVKPPWGTLTAIDLNTGAVVWKDTLGDYPEFKAKGIHTGTENYGGPVVTAGGLLFIAATKDSKIRAFDKKTGVLLWEADLPASGFATPTVYQKDGKEYVVIACGGGKLKTTSGDAYVAFALPSQKK